MESISEKLFSFFLKIPSRFYIPIILASIGLIFLGIGTMQYVSSSQEKTSTEAVLPAKTDVMNPSPIVGIKVDVEGGVMHPGVYSLASNTRIQDGLIAAGGLSANADRVLVAKSINLAAKVLDGAKIYIPTIGEKSPTNSVATKQAIGFDFSGAQVHLVDLNSASSDELDSLPGVGPVTAQKIINARPYSAVEDLQKRKIVSTSIFQKIKDKVTVN